MTELKFKCKTMSIVNVLVEKLEWILIIAFNESANLEAKHSENSYLTILSPEARLALLVGADSRGEVARQAVAAAALFGAAYFIHILHTKTLNILST